MGNKSPLKNYSKCNCCGIRELCLPSIFPESSLELVSSIIRSNCPFKKGQPLFNIGEPFKAIYAIKSGSFKSIIIDSNGEEQITCFHLPGEIIGLDSLSSTNFMSSAIALEDSIVCTIPYQQLEKLNHQVDGLCKQMVCLVCDEIINDQKLLLILGQKPADEKIAALLCNLSARFKARHRSHLSYRLPMSRHDIANFLGLTIETVSRVLKSFKQNHIIHIKGHNVELLNIDKLIRLAGIKFQ
jgi:CRP/FNR family transcriptional regulator